jgi:type IV pilus assembly protein PilC
MARFNYLANDNQNKQVKGAIEAKDLLEAKTKLRQSGLYIIWVRREGTVIEGLSFDRIRDQDLAIFSHQFAVMIASGIPLIRALKAIEDEATNKRLRTVLNKVRIEVENGVSLSTALSRHPKVFSNFFVSLVKSGEAAGILPNVLKRLAEHLEKEEDLRRKVSSSFAYPVIVGFVAFGVVAFLLIFIVPVFRSTYKSLKIGLPGPTLTLISLSNIFIKFWWLILLLIGVGFYIFTVSKYNATIGLIVDRLRLRLPVFGQLNRKVALSRLVRTLSTMIGSGLTLNTSLNIAKEVVGNRVVAKTIGAIQDEISQGKQISDSLKAKALFPPMVVQMISVGEESGSLNTMLDKCADFLDEDIDQLIKNLVVKIEPALTSLLAVVVGFIALAIYLPMFDLIRQISK